MPQNDCKIVITNDISAYTIYIYAYSQSDSTFWGGTNTFCIDPAKTFAYHGDAMDTPCSAGKAYGMRAIDTGGSDTYTYYLRD